MTVPHVVYHCAAMGNWPEVVREQMLLLRESGLAAGLAGCGDSVRVTHVGPPDTAQAVLAEAGRQDVPATLVRTDPNVSHYETFAMLEIERLAKVERTDRPVLYFHTKGVSAPHDRTKTLWRQAMGRYVVSMWRDNLAVIADGAGYDAAGFNWWDRGSRHFSGTFWVARADWLRKLPDFVRFHHSKGLVRYSCELWIGSAPGCRAYTRGTMDAVTWTGRFDFTPHLPPPYTPAAEITWVTAATPGYIDDLNRLLNSVRLLGPGHRVHAEVLPDRPGPWRHATKLEVMRRAVAAAPTSHVFWVDGDCEFLTTLRPDDFFSPDRPLVAVRHFAYTNPKHHIPKRLHSRLPGDPHPCYWQACLWGGERAAVAGVLDRLRWLDADDHGYDEHALNIDFQYRVGTVHTLPCRYATPPDFGPFPQYRESYNARAGGEARVRHHNREIRR